MLVNYRTCDHCGKKLNDMKDYPEIDFGITYGITADICSECFDELNKIIKNFVKGELQDAEVH